MAERPLRILHVSTSDRTGGAEKVAASLFESFRTRGHASWLAVGHRRATDPDVLTIPNEQRRGGWYHFWRSLGAHLEGRRGDFGETLPASPTAATRLIGRFTRAIADPLGAIESRLGIEDYRFPGTRQLLDLSPQRPDIVHAHNLHGGYFDLGLLPWLSRQAPVLLTLHDAWLLSGHCAHSLACERWQTGCGRCPDLTIYPALHRDATSYNWRRKRRIYAQSRLYLATPSHWLMQKVERSMLCPAIVEARVIPNGLDLTTFRPADRQAARAALGISQESRMLLFTANGIRRNVWKDYEGMRAAVAMVAERLHGHSLLFVALGEDAPPEQVGRAEVRFVPYQSDPTAVAMYYQAADVYVHAAKADTFPTTVLEALACGTPVVATAVGGIPEQVRGLPNWTSDAPHSAPDSTGILVPPGDAAAMAAALSRLLTDEALCRWLGEAAAQDAQSRFDQRRQVDAYLAWYSEIVCRWSKEREVICAAPV